MDLNTKRIQNATNAFFRASDPEFRKFWLRVIEHLSANRSRDPVLYN